MTPEQSPPVPVLMYHEIVQPPETTSRLAVSPAALAAQLAHLHDAGLHDGDRGRAGDGPGSGTAGLPSGPSC